MSKRKNESSSDGEPEQKRVKTVDAFHLCDETGETVCCNQCKKHVCESCIEKFDDRPSGVTDPSLAICKNCVLHSQLITCERCMCETVLYPNEIKRTMAYCSCPGNMRCTKCLDEIRLEDKIYQLNPCTQCTRTCPRCGDAETRFVVCDNCAEIVCYNCSVCFKVGKSIYGFCSERCDDLYCEGDYSLCYDRISPEDEEDAVFRRNLERAANECRMM